MQVPAWESIRDTESSSTKFQSLFVRILQLYLDSPVLGDAGEGSETRLSVKEKTIVLIFFINCFQSLEEPMVRQVSPILIRCSLSCKHRHMCPFLICCYQVVLRLCSLRLWEALSPARRNVELEEFPQLKRHWQHLQVKKEAAAKVVH